MRSTDLLGALAYNEWRETRRLVAPPPSDPAAAGVAAFVGLLFSIAILCGFLWIVFALRGFLSPALTPVAL
jgi:hypothetical protein